MDFLFQLFTFFMLKKVYFSLKENKIHQIKLKMKIEDKFKWMWLDDLFFPLFEYNLFK
jgi:hypothetical protein